MNRLRTALAGAALATLGLSAQAEAGTYFKLVCGDNAIALARQIHGPRYLAPSEISKASPGSPESLVLALIKSISRFPQEEIAQAVSANGILVSSPFDRPAPLPGGTGTCLVIATGAVASEARDSLNAAGASPLPGVSAAETLSSTLKSLDRAAHELVTASSL